MTKGSTAETKEKLGVGEKMVLDRRGLLASILLNNKIWQKIVDYYNNKYKNNPGILDQINLISRDDKVRSSSFLTPSRKNKLRQAHFYNFDLQPSESKSASSKTNRP